MGVFVDSHWNGRFFGWDEAFNSMALATSGKFGDSRKVADFRTSLLDKAIFWVNKNGKKRSSGARFVWESMELGEEGSPYGFWMEHIFHMSNMVMSTWGHYLYSNDAEFLEHNYELMVESSLYYIKNRLYNIDGKLKVGYCTDLERMGEAKLNPFMTSCGIIYTLENLRFASRRITAFGRTAVDSYFSRVAPSLCEILFACSAIYAPHSGSEDSAILSEGPVAQTAAIG